ncbi:PREDICTED: uncharacterized protein LOC107103050 [Cyprinodon variegatus]|uniref:uncharacterized protein LOC107103050 n=1 Tax=Cyprinodon variegatus TaxID=28743 RepID=UPI000742AD54|nr:PREDICTED: uncharacterized protein LOC107103050 [Cyprinodon variegatus]
MVVVGSAGGFSALTRKNGIKVGAGSPCSVEEVCLAVGEVIGHESIKSAARMSGAVVLFVERVEAGIAVNGLFLQVSPLTLPATRVTLSNVPLFISDEFLIRELSRHRKVVSPIKKVMSGCKSPLLKHVVSHRRQLFMLLNKQDEELNLRFHVRLDGFDYMLFATSSNMKCFGCGQEGHVIKVCPDGAGRWPAAAEQMGPPASVAAAAGGTRCGEGARCCCGEPTAYAPEESAAAAAEEPAAVAAEEPAAAAEGPAAAAAAGGAAVVSEGPAAAEEEPMVEEPAPEEPLVCGARLDVHDGSVPGLPETLSRSGAVTLRHLVRVAGPDFSGVEEVRSLLGVRSARWVRRFLERLKEQMTAGERRLLQLHATGKRPPDTSDPFPDVYMYPDFEEDSGPLLQSQRMDLCKTDPKTLYRTCTKVLNKRTLHNRATRVWTDKFRGQKPQWRTLYKPPIKKRTGDLQWRILHCAIASNAFLSVISPEVLNKCPFCSLPESVFHVFMDCVQLTGFFNFLMNVFSLFSVVFTHSLFINGVHYNRATAFKSRILNYLISEAKMAIYLTRRDKLQEGPQLDAVALWKCNIKARLRLEFCFHRATGDLKGFIQLWGFNNVLCTISEPGELKYNKLLL